MVTNLTNITKANVTFYDMVDYSNDVTNGLVGLMLIIVVFLILLTNFMRKYEFEEAMLASSFICFGLAIFLRAIELISFQFMIMFAVIAGLTAFWVAISKR